MKEVDALIATDPHDPYFLELKGQILLESGKPRQALPPLREAVQRSGNKPMITAMLGHALIATEDPANFEEARRILKLSVARDNENPFRSEEHTSELQSLMRISYAVFCLKQKKHYTL